MVLKGHREQKCPTAPIVESRFVQKGRKKDFSGAAELLITTNKYLM